MTVQLSVKLFPTSNMELLVSILTLRGSKTVNSISTFSSPAELFIIQKYFPLSKSVTLFKTKIFLFEVPFIVSVALLSLDFLSHLYVGTGHPWPPHTRITDSHFLARICLKFVNTLGRRLVVGSMKYSFFLEKIKNCFQHLTRLT